MSSALRWCRRRSYASRGAPESHRCSRPWAQPSALRRGLAPNGPDPAGRREALPRGRQGAPRGSSPRPPRMSKRVDAMRATRCVVAYGRPARESLLVASRSRDPHRPAALCTRRCWRRRSRLAQNGSSGVSRDLCLSTTHADRARRVHGPRSRWIARRSARGVAPFGNGRYRRHVGVDAIEPGVVRLEAGFAGPAGDGIAGGLLRDHDVP